MHISHIEPGDYIEVYWSDVPTVQVCIYIGPEMTDIESDNECLKVITADGELNNTNGAGVRVILDMPNAKYAAAERQAQYAIPAS